MLTQLSNSTYRIAAQAILCAVAAIILLTFRHYGITWDEELQSQYGQAVVDYYFSGFKDQRYAQIFNLYLYGGMFDGLASLIDHYTPFSTYETRHLVNAFFGLLGLWGTWRLARFIGGNTVGLIALIFLILTPVYYGHMFNNPKDIPFATGLIWTLYFMARCMSDLLRPKWGLIIKLSIVLGLTLGVRVGGIMVLIFWLVPMGLWPLLPFIKQPNTTTLRTSFITLLNYGFRLVLPVTVIAYIVMLICWPWAQQAPITNPLRALSEFSNFPQDVEVLLNGVIHRSTQLPWFYVPVYFGIQLPELILLLLLASIPTMPFIWRKLRQPQRQALLLISLMGFVPVGYAMLHHPALYDAVRHFMFAVPIICIIAALTAHHLFKWAVAEFDHTWSQKLIALSLYSLFTIFVFTQITIMAQLHPYEYIYANRLTGGVAGAYGKYELDYWGTSFKEAAQRIQDTVNKEGGVPPGKIYRIAICGPWDAAMIYLPPDYQPVVANEPAEFFLSTTRWMCQNMRPGKDIIRIERMGVPLSVVKDLR